MDETKKYVARDLPFAADPVLQVMGVRVGALRAAVSRGFEALLAREDVVVGQEFIMTFGVLERMMECSLSVEYLALKGRPRDAAVLVLTLIELRLDLQYAEQDAARASAWLANANEGRKAWRVAEQIRAIFVSSSEREAELANYRHFSMVKHGNPLGGIASFPVELSAEGIALRTDPDDKADVNLCITCLFAAGSCLHAAFSAATRLLGATGDEIDQATAEIDKAMRVVSEVQETHVRTMLEAWISPSLMRDT